MKHLLMGLACAAMLLGSSAFAQQKDEGNANKNQQAQNQQQKGQQQMIRGTVTGVTGVTAVGEAVIDPQSREAVVAEADYLTVLGSPSHGPRFQGTAGNQNQAKQAKQAGQNHNRQNLYFIALTPKTKVHWAKQAGQNQKTSQAPGQKKAQSALEDLEIGDRVEVQFNKTEQLQAKSEGSKSGQERTAGFRGDEKSKKHGRDRIFVGLASEISILSAPMNRKGRNQKARTNNRIRTKI